jgi:hypothetical protein
VQSKSHIPQVMYTAALARPRNSPHSNEYFNGLIGTVAHVNYVYAQRNSINRPAGTLLAEPYNITVDSFYEHMTAHDGMLEVIHEAMRRHLGDRQIIVQMDNAPGHVGEGNIHHLQAFCDARGMNMRLIPQPANSPDLNICDLAFFRSLDMRIAEYKATSRTIIDLIDAIQQGYGEYDDEKLNSAYGHLFAVFRKILEFRGGNNFPSPHDNVRNNIRTGNPLNFLQPEMDRDAINALIDKVNAHFHGRRQDLARF